MKIVEESSIFPQVHRFYTSRWDLIFTRFSQGILSISERVQIDRPIRESRCKAIDSRCQTSRASQRAGVSFLSSSLSLSLSCFAQQKVINYASRESGGSLFPQARPGEHRFGNNVPGPSLLSNVSCNVTGLVLSAILFSRARRIDPALGIVSPFVRPRREILPGWTFRRLVTSPPPPPILSPDVHLPLPALLYFAGIHLARPNRTTRFQWQYYCCKIIYDSWHPSRSISIVTFDVDQLFL